MSVRLRMIKRDRDLLAGVIFVVCLGVSVVLAQVIMAVASA